MKREWIEQAHHAVPASTAARAWKWLFPPAPVSEASLLAHQRSALRRQVPVLLSVLFIASILLGYAHWGAVDAQILVAWVGANWLYCGYGAWRWRLRLRVAHPRSPTRHFAHRALIHNLVPGAIWGAAAVLFFVPERFDLQIFLVFMLAGMAAGMVAAAPTMPAAAVAFVVPTLVPLGVQMFAIGTRPASVIATMICVYLAALLFMLRNGYTAFCDGIVAAERAQMAEEVLRDSLEALHDGYVLYGPDLRVRMHNRRFIEIMGLGDMASLVGTRFAEHARLFAERGVFGPDDDYAVDLDGTIAARTKVLLSGKRSQVERRLADGRTLLVTVHPVSGGGSVVMFTDVSALKRAEERLRAAIEAMDDGFVLFGPDNRVVLHNRRYVDHYPFLKRYPTIVGMRREDIVRVAVESGAINGVTSGEESGRWIAREVASWKGNASAKFERHLSDGRTLLTRFRPTENGTVVVATDITALKQAEQRLRAAIEAMDSGFILFDAEERIVLTNKHFLLHYHALESFKPLIGRTRGEMLLHMAKSGELAGVAEAGGPEAWTEAQLEALRISPHREFERKTSDGRTILVRAQPIPERGSVVVTTDVTDVKRAERRLVDAVESMSDAFVLWDAEDRLVLYNSAWARMFEGVPDATAVGKRFEDIVRVGVAAGAFPEAAGREEDYVCERLRRHRNPDETVIQPFRDGRWLRYSERRTSEGGIVGLRADVTDEVKRERALRESQQELAERVRELETMQRQLQNQRDELSKLMRQVIQARDEAATANAAKSVFLANMSHELRTPLNAIIGFAEIMDSALFGPLGHDRYQGYVGDMLSAAKHLLRLINDILDLSKIEAGKWELREELVDTQRMLDSVMRLFRGRDEARRLEFRVDTQPGLPPLLADERALKQIIINALSNSIKFTPAGGRIRVRARRDGAGRLHVAVGDTGIGIKREDMAKALAPFGQVDNPMTRRHQGTGLGLSIARALAEQHGGRLRLRSRPGRGTVVVITLPAERFRDDGSLAHPNLVAAAE
jgi:signal transduction histidine kinase